MRRWRWMQPISTRPSVLWCFNRCLGCDKADRAVDWDLVFFNFFQMGIVKPLNELNVDFGYLFPLRDGLKQPNCSLNGPSQGHSVFEILWASRAPFFLNATNEMHCVPWTLEVKHHGCHPSRRIPPISAVRRRWSWKLKGLILLEPSESAWASWCVSTLTWQATARTHLRSPIGKNVDRRR